MKQLLLACASLFIASSVRAEFHTDCDPGLDGKCCIKNTTGGGYYTISCPDDCYKDGHTDTLDLHRVCMPDSGKCECHGNADRCGDGVTIPQDPCFCPDGGDKFGAHPSGRCRVGTCEEQSSLGIAPPDLGCKDEQGKSVEAKCAPKVECICPECGNGSKVGHQWYCEGGSSSSSNSSVAYTPAPGNAALRPPNIATN